MISRRERLQINRSCLQCGQPYHPWSSRQKFCCRSCSVSARREAWAIWLVDALEAQALAARNDQM